MVGKCIHICIYVKVSMFPRQNKYFGCHLAESMCEYCSENIMAEPGFVKYSCVIHVQLRVGVALVT